MSNPSIQASNEEPTVEPIVETTVEPVVEESSSKIDEKPEKKKRCYSEVWLDFDRIDKIEKKTVDGKEVVTKIIRAKCKHCTFETDGRSIRGTTHLKNHIAKCTKKKRPDIRQQLVQATMKNEDGTCALSNYQFDNEKSQNLLAKAIIVHEYPFNIVTHEFFLKYVHSLRPNHKIPKRTHITKLCIKIYEDYKKSLFDLFAKSSIRLSLTMDKWTSSSQNLSYLCITAHFVDESWKLQKRIIGFIKVHGSTGKDICNVLISCLLEWKIDNKILSITVDNDKANDVAVKLGKERLKKWLPCGGVFFHVRCGAHIINLIVQEGLKVITKAIEKVRLSVKYVTCSPKMEENFYHVAKQANVEKEKCLVLDCCTRWNSTYLMLTIALKYKVAFNRFELRDDKYLHCPSEEEWNYIETLSKCLKHFYDATNLLSGTIYPTCNLLFEEFCEIHLLLMEWLKSNDDTIVAMAFAMKRKFDKYWDMCNKIFAVATFLDPRYKMIAIKYFFGLIYGVNGEKCTNDIFDVIKKMHEEYALRDKEESKNVENASSSQTKEVERVGDKRKSRFAQFVETIDKEPTKTDLDLYMEESIITEWDDEKMGKFDILSWWKANFGKYPILAKVARDVLGIPASTVASESAFSTGGRVIHCYRSRMTTDTVEAMICAQDWIKAEQGGK